MRSHRAPDDQRPLEQRLAQPVGAGGERLHLRVHGVRVAVLEQVDHEPGVRLELQLEIADLARQREHLGRRLDPVCQVGRVPQHPAARRAGMGARLGIGELGGDVRRLLAERLHPVAVRGVVDRPAQAGQQSYTERGAVAVGHLERTVEQCQQLLVEHSGLLHVTP